MSGKMGSRKKTLAYMDRRAGRAATAALAGLFLLLPGCGSVSLWPFGDKGNADQSLVPADATEYQCAGGRRFYVRFLDNGNAAWIIFPDREYRLDKVASGGGTRYSNGSDTLAVNDRAATLTDKSGAA